MDTYRTITSWGGARWCHYPVSTVTNLPGAAFRPRPLGLPPSGEEAPPAAEDTPPSQKAPLRAAPAPPHVPIRGGAGAGAQGTPRVPVPHHRPGAGLA